MLTHINKKNLIHKISVHLKEELSVLLRAANQAHSAAVDEQSVAETQYDTLAIEAGYLAEGQSNRANAIRAEINTLAELVIREFTADIPINLGALVQIYHDNAKPHWFFILPVAAGFKGTFLQPEVTQQKGIQHSFTVITPQSPMGAALINQYQSDDIQINSGRGTLHGSILQVR